MTMTTVQEPGAAPPAARRATASMIVLDDSRKKAISEVHGDRTPDDPWYRVKWMQDNLPFDSEKRLIPDDGQTGPKQGIGTDGKLCFFAPLYDEKRRDDLKRKLDRLSKHLPAEADDPVAAAEAAKLEEQQDIDDVNLTWWIHGETGDGKPVNYEFRLVKDAIAKRFAKKVQSIKEAVEFLVNDPDARIATYDEVAPRYRVYLEKPE